MAWFDDEKNRVGALCLRLAQDTSLLQGATGTRLGVIIQAFCAMSIGDTINKKKKRHPSYLFYYYYYNYNLMFVATILSFFFAWKMAIVTLCSIPFVFTGVYIESLFLRGNHYQSSESMENASKVHIYIYIFFKVLYIIRKFK